MKSLRMNNIGARASWHKDCLSNCVNTSRLPVLLALVCLAGVSPQFVYADIPPFTATGTATDGQSLSAEATFTSGVPWPIPH